MRDIICFAVWFCIFEVLDFIPDRIFGYRLISFILYVVAFWMIETIFMWITTKKHTVVIENKAEKVRKGLFGTFTRRIVKTTNGDVFECINNWPLLSNAKTKFTKLKVGKKYQITTCRPILIGPVRWIKDVHEIKTTKRRVVKK